MFGRPNSPSTPPELAIWLMEYNAQPRLHLIETPRCLSFCQSNKKKKNFSGEGSPEPLIYSRVAFWKPVLVIEKIVEPGCPVSIRIIRSWNRKSQKSEFIIVKKDVIIWKGIKSLEKRLNSYNHWLPLLRAQVWFLKGCMLTHSHR